MSGDMTSSPEGNNAIFIFWCSVRENIILKPAASAEVPRCPDVSQHVCFTFGTKNTDFHLYCGGRAVDEYKDMPSVDMSSCIVSERLKDFSSVLVLDMKSKLGSEKNLLQQVCLT